ncbi:hypothetical protein GCM10023211_06430 [Orbus sasakiae]|uniref:TPM domain-containing protein n=2 Tax=Orbus sasakiae TaxID=1078475 RepID=A0ABP9N338_9GAMM
MQDGITDTVGLLSPNDFQSINSKIMALEQSTGAQLSILIINSTEGISIEQYAYEVFNAWRIGRLTVDDGVLVLVALQDRAVRIEVGYGLEGQITDYFARHVINDYIVPFFRAEQYAQGIDKTVDVLIAKIKQEPLPAVGKTPFYIAKQAEPIGVIDIIAAAVIGSALLLFFWGVISAVKSSPIKAGLPVLLIVLLTGYFGGFDLSTGNGMNFGEDFLREDLPRWVQMLFLQIFPSWFSVVMIFMCFITSIMITIGFLFIICYVPSKFIKSAKLKSSLLSGFIFGLFSGVFIGSILRSGILGLFGGLIFGLLITVGFYFGIIKPGNSSHSSSRGSYSRSSHSSSSSSSSSSRSSGGGGRSGGGGASGRW